MLFRSGACQQSSPKLWGACVCSYFLLIFKLGSLFSSSFLGGVLCFPLYLLIGYYMNIGRLFILWYFNVNFISLLNSLIFFFFSILSMDPFVLF